MSARLLPCAVMFLLVAASTLHAMGSPDSDVKRMSEFHPVIAQARGDVKILQEGDKDWIEASAGMLLLSGDEIMTGEDSQAEIRFASGTVHIYENSVMMIPTIGPERKRKDIRNIFIDEGAGRFLINPKGAREGFEFRTKTIQGSVRGTVFTVNVKETYTIVVVSRGVVELSDAEGESERTFVVEKGEAVRLNKSTVFDDINVLNVNETSDPVIKETLDLQIIEEKVDPGKVDEIKNSVEDRSSITGRDQDGTNSNTVK